MISEKWNMHLSRKLEKVIGKVNSIKGNIFCLTGTKKKERS
jgi:hypothetical protein